MFGAPGEQRARPPALRATIATVSTDTFFPARGDPAVAPVGSVPCHPSRAANPREPEARRRPHGASQFTGSPRARAGMDQDEGDPKIEAPAQCRFENELFCGAEGSRGGRGVLFHSLLSPVRGSHVLGHSTGAGAGAGQAALQGAVAKPHVLHCDPVETWRDRAWGQVQNTGQHWTPLPSSGGWCWGSRTPSAPSCVSRGAVKNLSLTAHLPFIKGIPSPHFSRLHVGKVNSLCH